MRHGEMTVWIAKRRILIAFCSLRAEEAAFV